MTEENETGVREVARHLGIRRATVVHKNFRKNHEWCRPEDGFLTIFVPQKTKHGTRLVPRVSYPAGDIHEIRWED